MEKEEKIKQNLSKKEKLKKKKKQQYKSEKDKYFNYYDDIKSSTHKVVDW